MQKIVTKKYIIAVAIALSFFGMAGQVHAKTANWASGTIPTTLEAVQYDAAFCYQNCETEPETTPKYFTPAAIYNTSATITHAATVVDNTTGANISDGGSVSVGDKITITPQANQSTDISWFASGGAADSPYGSWGGGAINCPGAGTNDPGNGYLQTNTIQSGNDEETFQTFANLAVTPTTPTISTAGSTAGLTNDGGGTYTVTSAGTIDASVTYPPTVGQYYFSYYKTGQLPRGEDYTGGDGCHALPNPMADSSKLAKDECTWSPNTKDESECLADPANAFDLAVPAIPITFTITAKGSNAPTPPQITGPTQGDTCSTDNYTYTFTGTDPGGNAVRYGVDWNDDGTVDEWVPATSYVPSGTPQSTTHSWNTTGTVTFEALTQNAQGGNSGWTKYTVTVSPCLPDLTASLVAGQENLTGTVGVPVPVEATVSNIGEGPTGAPFQTTFWAQGQDGSNPQYVEFTSGDPGPGNPPPGGFAPGVHEIDGPQVPVEFTFSSPGTYVYRACANDNQNWVLTVPETNGSNNCSDWGTITISNSNGGGGGDGAVMCTDDAISPVAPGTTITFTAAPSGDAGGPYTWSMNGSQIPGSGSTLQYTIPTDAQNGSNYVMTVQATGASAEGTCEPSITVGSGNGECAASALPTITANGQIGSVLVNAGDTALIAWDATNAGGACTITGPGVNQSASCTDPDGSANPTITTQSKYTISCPSGNDSVIVNVNPKFKEY